MNNVNENILDIECIVSILKHTCSQPLPQFVPKDKQLEVRRETLKMIADELNEDVTKLLNNLNK